jgi:hypothetical protein
VIHPPTFDLFVRVVLVEGVSAGAMSATPPDGSKGSEERRGTLWARPVLIILTAARRYEPELLPTATKPGVESICGECSYWERKPFKL